MNITFLGGGNEIGASSAIVEIGAARILVDCGIRMSGEDRLPDLAALKGGQFRQLDAALLTHAHMDHSGALPVLHRHFPAVPVYTTAATHGLVEVLLRDSLNVMRVKAESENELPLYAASAVNELLEKIIPVPVGSPLQIGRTGLTATWFPAGHILGAASIGIEGVERGRTIRVLFSGDIAVGDQLTVPGMLAPKGFRPDVLVIESTYGDRLHSARELEEQRLIEMVAGVIERKGKLLIPAFAIGRAQEVILMLLKQFRAKRMASFPVFVDGMVKSICGVYSAFPAHQTPYARRLIEKHGNPFFNVVDEIRQVATPAEREKVLTGDPCVIVASSGMLTGGASAFYAQQLVGDERNGIAITGYQDEESPGRQLLDLAEAATREVAIAGKTYEVKAGVAKYALSAHADCNEIAGLIEAINPRQVVLVHGEGNARPALAELLRRQGTRHRPIHLPRTGDTLSFGAIRRVSSDLRPQTSDLRPLGDGERLNAEKLSAFAQKLREAGEEGKLYSEIDLLNRWHGEHEWDEEHYGELIRLLDDNDDDFRRAKARPHLYRLLRPEAEDESEAATLFYAEPNELLARLEKAFDEAAGLYRTGYDLATHTLRLSFAFPLVARERYRAQLDELVAGTGWTYSFNDKPHQARLAERALACLPEGIQAAKAPAIRPDTSEVTLKLDERLDSEAAQAAVERFAAETGCTLRLVMPAPVVVAPSVAVEITNDVVALPAMPPPLVSLQLAFDPPAGVRRMPFSQAYFLALDAYSLAPEHLRPAKVSQKRDERGEFIQLAFTTPQIGLRQRATLDTLLAQTGWRIVIKAEPNLAALIAAARRLLPAEWRVRKEPGVHKEYGLVRARCLNAPPAGEARLNEVCEQFLAETGYRLEIG
jgi:Cft2 family RNA processing exonuclease